MKMFRRMLASLLVMTTVIFAQPANAEVNELRLSRTTTLAYLPIFIVQQEKLIEKHAAMNGMPNLKVSWLNFTGPTAQVDALLSGNVDIITTGVTSLITLWAKTKGSSLEVKGVTALGTLPTALNSRNPKVKSIRDFTDNDRIAVPSVKSSYQAMLLQMAAAKEWGIKNYSRLDNLTVSLGQMDAVAALMSPNHEVNNDFATPPFMYLEQAQTGIHQVISAKEILGTLATAAVTNATSKFYDANPTVMKIFKDAVNEAMVVIEKDKERAMNGYYGATNDKKTERSMLLKILTDPDTQFTAKPNAIKLYTDFMFATGAINKAPANDAEMFFPM